jgi:hypothetical protein
MRWSSWKAPLVVVLLSTGLAWGQRVAAPPAPVEGERYLLVGDPAQKCRVLAAWRMEDGRRAYDVQSLNGGEIMTLYEAPDVKARPGGGLLGKLRMRIARWGGARARPAGLPAPPGSPAEASGSFELAGSCTSGACGELACEGGMPAPTYAQTGEPPAMHGMIVRGPTGSPYYPSPLPGGRVVAQGTMVETPPPPAPPDLDTARPKSRTAAVGPDVVLPAVPLTAGLPARPVPPKAPMLSELASKTTAPAFPPAWSPPQPGTFAAQQPKPGDGNSQWGRPAAQAKASSPLLPDPSEVTPPTASLPAAPPSVPAGPSPAPGPSPVAQRSRKADPPLPASRVEAPGSLDPLADLNHLLSPAAEKKLNQPAATAGGARPGGVLAALAGKPASTTLPPAPPVAATPPAYKPGDQVGGQVPLGAQSVYAANLDGSQPRYVPVPIVTMPQPKDPPTPPAPKIPEPPKGPDLLANAFSQAASQGAGHGGQPAPWQNAFSPQGAGQAAPPGGPQAMPGPGSPGPVAQYPMAPPGMVPYPPAYAMSRYPYPPAGPAMPGYGGMPMAQPGGMGPNGAVPAGYYGPMATPAGAAWPQGQPPAGMPYANPAMDRPGLPVSLPTTAAVASPDAVQQMAVVLRTSLYPSQREWSAEYLAGVDWRTHPQVLPALVSAAREDPAPTVRAACVHCLARMNVSTDLVSGALRGLRADPDVGVRTAAEQALARLSPSPAAPIQPVGGPGGKE